jgi:isoleucyl-tRNA synthetase
VLEDGSVRVGEVVLNSNEVEVGFTGKAGLAVESGGGFVIALDTALTPDLELEGQARDMVREIQDMRKEADLRISDRIRLSFNSAGDSDAERLKAISQRHLEYIKSETLCVEVVENLGEYELERVVDIEGLKISVKLIRL